ncbi:hypothetical protein ES703_41977 [subsurface metagenome]
MVETEDALLITHKNMAQKVKDIVEEIKQKGKVKYL